MQRFIRIDRQSSTNRYRLPEQAVVDLEIVRGDARHRLRRVEVPVFLIGTADDCDLVLVEPGIPAVHTYLFVRPEGVSIRTLGAAPPLTVTGRAVENALLTDGDDFCIGPFEFVIHVRPGSGPDDDRTAGRRSARGFENEGETGGFDAGGADATRALVVVRQSVLVRKLRRFAEPPNPLPWLLAGRCPEQRATA